MADVTIAAAVETASDTVISNVQYGEAVSIGEAVYLKASDAKYWLAVNTAEASAAVKGIALTGNAADGYGVIATGGGVEIGTVAVGEIYTAASTAGAIHPDTDLATTEFVSQIGIGKTAAILQIGINNTGIQHA